MIFKRNPTKLDIDLSNLEAICSQKDLILLRVKFVEKDSNNYIIEARYRGKIYGTEKELPSDISFYDFVHLILTDEKLEILIKDAENLKDLRLEIKWQSFNLDEILKERDRTNQQESKLNFINEISNTTLKSSVIQDNKSHHYEVDSYDENSYNLEKYPTFLCCGPDNNVYYVDQNWRLFRIDTEANKQDQIYSFPKLCIKPDDKFFVLEKNLFVYNNQDERNIYFLNLNDKQLPSSINIEVIDYFISQKRNLGIIESNDKKCYLFNFKSKDFQELPEDINAIGIVELNDSKIVTFSSVGILTLLEINSDLKSKRISSFELENYDDSQQTVMDLSYDGNYLIVGNNKTVSIFRFSNNDNRIELKNKKTLFQDNDDENLFKLFMIGKTRVCLLSVKAEIYYSSYYVFENENLKDDSQNVKEKMNGTYYSGFNNCLAFQKENLGLKIMKIKSPSLDQTKNI